MLPRVAFFCIDILLPLKDLGFLLRGSGVRADRAIHIRTADLLLTMSCLEWT